MAATQSSPLSEREGGDTPKVGMFSAEWCIGPQIALGGSDYWRLALPAAKLYENGWDIKFARNLGEGSDGRLVIQDTEGEWLSDRDIIIIQRWMGEGTAERVLRAREAGQIIINEVDDNYWEFPESHVALGATAPQNNPSANREHYRETVAASSLITVSTRFLADELADWGPPVKLVRNYIDCGFWPLLPPGDFVGWVGGLPWRGNDLELLRPTVVPWLRKRKQFFYHGGSVAPSGDASIDKRLAYERVTTRPLAALFDYPVLLEPLRISLVPIDDTPFGRAKSWIKGLEAASRGVPFIVSDHAEYRELGIGRLVQHPEEWVYHLKALEDPDVYAADVTINRKRAEQLDIEHHWTEWADVLTESIGGERRLVAADRH